MTLLSEIQARKKIRRIAIGGILVVVAGMAYASYVRYSAQKKAQNLPSWQEYRVASGSVRETVSGDGKVLYRGYYHLGFPIAGRIAHVYKKEGEQVKTGEPLTALDDTYLRLDLQKARIALENARANLIAKQATAPSAEEVRIAEEQLRQAIVALENTKRQAESENLTTKKAVETASVNLRAAESETEATGNDARASLRNALDSVTISEKELKNAESDSARVLADGSGSLRDLREKGILAISSLLQTLSKDLYDTDILLGVTDTNRDKNDTFESYLGARNPEGKRRAETAFRKAKDAFEAFRTSWESVRGNPPYDETVSRMDLLSSVSESVSDTLAQTLSVLRNSISGSAFPQASIDASVDLFETSLSALKTQHTAFVASRQAIVTKETDLASERRSREEAVQVLRARLDLAKSGLEKTKSNAELLLKASQSKLDLARKQSESSELQYTATVNKGKDNVASASKQVDIARASLDAKKKRIDPKELAPYETAIRTAQNTVEEMEKHLSDTVLKSPTDGVVTKIELLAGEETSAGKPFLSIVDSTHPYIESDMEEIDVAKLRIGQPVDIRFDALEGVTLTGSVTFISPSSSIDANGIVTYRVDIAFDPGAAGVREGMTATVEYIVRQAENVLVVPVWTLSEADGKYSLFSIDRSANVPVEIGISDGKMTEVKSGVKLGERVRN